MNRIELMSNIENGKEGLFQFFDNLKISHNDTILIEKKKYNLMVSTLTDILQELNSNQGDQLWSSVFKICSEILQDYAKVLNTQHLQDKEEVNEKLAPIFLALQNVAALCISALQVSIMADNKYFIKTVSLLHMSMLNIKSSNVSKKMCELFLSCWEKEFPNRESLLVNPLIFLLSGYFEIGVKSKITLTEICNFQKAVRDLQLSDVAISNTDDIEVKESLMEVRQLLVSCCLSPGFLKGLTGQRFVANVMLIHTDVMKAVHRAIIANLPNQTNLNHVEGYGYIYYFAWMLSSDDFKVLIEEFGIQDIMYCAVHSTREDPNMFSLYHPILKGITEHKNSLRVHHMLTRLYNPIIWRALKGRNAIVRANAAELLFDVFPLTMPTDAANHNEGQFMTKQIDAVKDLLNDEYAQVRCIAILGICGVLEIYWDVIPSKCIAELIHIIFKTCAYDSGSIHVRESVFRGVIILLGNLCSHSVLIKLLPSVGKCLHDASEKVRIAFVDMLLEVIKINLIEFWHICPVASILAQMEVDNKSVCKRLVTLLHDSYLPQPMDLASWSSRMFCFLKHNPTAARKFYFYCDKLNTEECGLFINEITRVICSAVNNEQSENNNEFNNPTIIAGLLEVMCVLWKSFEANLANKMKNKTNKKECDDLRLILKKLTVKVLPQMTHICFKKYHDERCLNALLLISSYLHPSSIPIFSKGIIPKLRDLPDTAPFSYYSMLIKCIGEWGWNKELLELICDWIKSSLVEDDKIEASSQAKQRRSSTRIAKKSKAVKFNVEKREPRPEQALNYLSCLLESNMGLKYESETCRLLLFELIDHFQKLQQEIDRKLGGHNGKYCKWDNTLLFRSLDLNFKLLSSLHLSSKKVSEDDDDIKDSVELLKIKSLILWCGGVVLDSLNSASKQLHDQDTTALSTSILDVPSSQQILEQISLAKKTLDVFFPALHHLVDSGVPINETTFNFLGVFLQTGVKVVDYIGPLLTLFNKLHRRMLTLKWSQSDAGSFTEEKDEMLSDFDLILLAMLSYSRKNPEGFHQVFRSELRSNFQQIMRREFQLSTGVTNYTYNRITTMVISSVLSDLHHHLSSTFCMSDKISDLPEYCCSVLPLVLSTHGECEHIFVNTLPLIIEESAGSKDIVKPCISLLHTLQNDCKNVSAAKLCYDKLVENHKVFGEVLTEIKNEQADNSGVFDDSIM